jgi:hypothetical protein
MKEFLLKYLCWAVLRIMLGKARKGFFKLFNKFYKKFLKALKFFL